MFETGIVLVVLNFIEYASLKDVAPDVEEDNKLETIVRLVLPLTFDDVVDKTGYDASDSRRQLSVPPTPL